MKPWLSIWESVEFCLRLYRISPTWSSTTPFRFLGMNQEGGATAKGISYYASLPVGTAGILDPRDPPGYPMLVKFRDITDPMSVEVAQVWMQNDLGYFDLTDDRIENLFGKGVKLREIILEITSDPVTHTIDNYLPRTFYSDFFDRWTDLPYCERERLGDLTTFKQGDVY